MSGISCDVCKYGESHSYVKDNYYCRHPKSVRGIGDRPKVCNCNIGEIDEWKYNRKYKPMKNDTNVSKEVVYDEIKKILWGIKLKDIDTVMKELTEFQNRVISYREPYKCSTCKKEICQSYSNGMRNCSNWE